MGWTVVSDRPSDVKRSYHPSVARINGIGGAKENSLFAVDRLRSDPAIWFVRGWRYPNVSDCDDNSGLSWHVYCTVWKRACILRTVRRYSCMTKLFVLLKKTR